MMMVYLDHVNPNRKYSNMDCRACVQLPLDLYGVNPSIYNQTLKNPNVILVHLEASENSRNPDIGTIKK